MMTNSIWVLIEILPSGSTARIVLFSMSIRFPCWCFSSYCNYLGWSVPSSNELISSKQQITTFSSDSCPITCRKQSRRPWWCSSRRVCFCGENDDRNGCVCLMLSRPKSVSRLSMRVHPFCLRGCCVCWCAVLSFSHLHP